MLQPGGDIALTSERRGRPSLSKATCLRSSSITTLVLVGTTKFIRDVSC